MTEKRKLAKRIATFQFQLISEASGSGWHRDQHIEIEYLIDLIIDAAKEEVKEEKAYYTDEQRQKDKTHAARCKAIANASMDAAKEELNQEKRARLIDRSQQPDEIGEWEDFQPVFVCSCGERHFLTDIENMIETEIKGISK